jgi:hypothetical protein
LTATNSKGQTGRTTTTIIVDEPAVVEVTDDINADTTWGACRVYVIKAWDFWINAALEIEAGVIVKFDPDLGPGMNVAGTVVANGTEENPVIFTSYKDDATGGDTNEDGGATGPGPGDWNNIYVQSDGSIFDYCRFYYGGAGSDSTLEVYDSGATVTNCTFAHNMGGDYATLDASHALSNTLIVGNAFYDNERPLLLNTTFGIDDSNVFHNPDDSSEKNVYNGIFLDYPDAPILSHIAWGETEVPFVINHNDLWIEEDASLALADNVIVKFMPESELIHYGNIFNHDAPGVYFTSYNDDEHGGDTNGDGASTSASEGDWVGIYNNSADAYETWPNILYDEIH